MPINSRNKGARAEREFSHWLKEIGIDARRGQQFAGGKDSPDVITDLPGVHFEVKHVEALNLGNAMAQAVADAGENIPVVAHRKNRTVWHVTLRGKDLIRFCETVAKHLREKNGIN